MSSRPPIAVIGAGLMGHGIAQVFACAGHEVCIYDPSAAIRATVHARIRDNLTVLDQPHDAIDRVHAAPELVQAVQDARFIFECGPEDVALKQSIFADIESHATRSAILASNTSVIPITRIVEKLKDPSRALGTHWWNPPYLIPLVEVIRTQQTSESTMSAVLQLLAAIGKTPVRVEKDVPGFVGNRLQHALWREAIALVQEGVCDAATVDTVVKASFGRRLAVLGPLENADLVGTDLTLAIHRTVLPSLDRSETPLPLLRELVATGRLGMKSGEGFRRWTPQQQAELRARVLLYLKQFDDRDG